MEAPPISVIIPFYNGSRFIADTLASVFKQDLAPLEIIVIDDGSRPEEAIFLEPFQDRIKIIHQANAGVSAARNVGIASARGSWIAFLDQDDLWESNKLSKQWSYIQQHPECQAVHTAVNGTKPDGSEVIYRKKHLELDDFLHGDPNPSYLSSTMIRKDSLLMAGLFNPTLPFNQDFECFLRCARHFSFHYLDEVLTTRINHAANLSSNYLGVWLENIGIVRFYASQYKSYDAYRKRLYLLHVSYALLTISRRNFRGLIKIIKECGKDDFSRIVFTCNILFRLIWNKVNLKFNKKQGQLIGLQPR